MYTGKTTAAKTALSIIGQAKNSFLMKTKRTSDAIDIERCCTSTLPFCLDDPKTTDGIGEILIELCNGEPLANMKTGLRTGVALRLFNNVIRQSVSQVGED